MTYEVIILGHLHMPLYFIGTFTEYSYNYSAFKSFEIYRNRMKPGNGPG